MPLEISETETLTSTTQELLQTLLRQLSRGLVLDVTRLSQLATALHKAHTEIYRDMQIQDIKDLPPPLIRLQRTQQENQALQVLVWGINCEEHLFNKKTLL